VVFRGGGKGGFGWFGSKVYWFSAVLLQIDCINKEYRVCTSCYVIKRPRVVYLESPFKLREGDEFVR